MELAPESQEAAHTVRPCSNFQTYVDSVNQSATKAIGIEHSVYTMMRNHTEVVEPVLAQLETLIASTAELTKELETLNSCGSNGNL